MFLFLVVCVRLLSKTAKDEDSQNNRRLLAIIIQIACIVYKYKLINSYYRNKFISLYCAVIYSRWKPFRYRQRQREVEMSVHSLLRTARLNHWRRISRRCFRSLWETGMCRLRSSVCMLLIPRIYGC